MTVATNQEETALGSRGDTLAGVLEARQGPRPQLRERARALGLDALSDVELFALLLERGTPGLPVEVRASRVFREGGGLAGLCTFGVHGLATELGLGVALGARVAAGLELGLRCARLAGAVRATEVSAGSAADVDAWARRRIVHLPHEELWALLLDARNRVLGERLLARGGLHALAIHARDVLRPVLREAVSAFVLVHNHPGGDPCPSPEDVRFTDQVARASEVVGVALLDHVVVARSGWVSMLEAGLLGRLDP